MQRWKLAERIQEVKPIPPPDSHYYFQMVEVVEQGYYCFQHLEQMVEVASAVEQRVAGLLVRCRYCCWQGHLLRVAASEVVVAYPLGC